MMASLGSMWSIMRWETSSSPFPIAAHPASHTPSSHPHHSHSHPPHTHSNNDGLIGLHVVHYETRDKQLRTDAETNLFLDTPTCEDTPTNLLVGKINLHTWTHTKRSQTLNGSRQKLQNILHAWSVSETFSTFTYNHHSDCSFHRIFCSSITLKEWKGPVYGHALLCCNTMYQCVPTNAYIHTPVEWVCHSLQWCPAPRPPLGKEGRSLRANLPWSTPHSLGQTVCVCMCVCVCVCVCDRNHLSSTYDFLASSLGNRLFINRCFSFKSVSTDSHCILPQR